MNSARTASRLTPIDPLYPTCESVKAELRVYPGDMRAAQVTEALGIRPTESCDRGQERTSSLGVVGKAKRTVWFLSSENMTASKDLRDHLNSLLDVLEPSSDRLLKLQEHAGVVMTICCVWWSTGEGGPTLWPEQMARMANLNLECTFDIYVYGEDDELEGEED